MKNRIKSGMISMLLIVSMLAASIIPANAAVLEPEEIYPKDTVDIENTVDLEDTVDIEGTVDLESTGDVDDVADIEDTNQLDLGEEIFDAEFAGSEESVETYTVSSDVFEQPDGAEQQQTETLKLEYQAHVAYVGWQSYVNAGEVAGALETGRPIEALRVSVSGVEGLGVKYSAHVAYQGWQSYVSNNEVSGTTGKSLAMEAIRLELTGERASEFDIYYRVYASEFGWLDWAKNGEAAGSQGYSADMRAVEIRVLPKDSTEAPNVTGTAFKKNIAVSYSAHVAYVGWQQYVSSGAKAGLPEYNRGIEALRVYVSEEGLGVKYSAHVAYMGWQPYVSDNAIAGTTGKTRSIEAMKLELTGERASDFDIYYRVYSKNFGWLGWAKNGEAAGSQGYSSEMQAIEIKILPKGSEEAPSVTNTGFKEKISLSYSAHVAYVGWQNYVYDSAVTGTTGCSRDMEAIKIISTNPEKLGVEYSAYVQDKGWQDYVSDDDVAGTTGESRSIQALKIRLTGEKADAYDVYYRAHVANLGWLDWAKNDVVVGSIGLNYGMQALQIMVVDKNAAAPGATAVPCCYQVHTEYCAYVRGSEWQTNVRDGAMAGTTGQSLEMDGLKVSVNGMENLGIRYSAHVAYVGWQSSVANGAVSGIPGQNRQIEAIKISLTGSAAKYYDVWYRVHSQEFGWMGWARNGEPAGTQGYEYPAQAIQIIVTPKETPAPGTTANAFKQYSEVMQYAKQILDRVGWNLQAAFNWASSQVRYVDVAAPAAGVSHATYYGTYGFKNRQGNCYVMASTFYWMAKLLGYEVYLVEGKVPLRRGGMGPHGWCEVVINGTTYVCDPDFTYDAGRNGYLITYGASGTWRYSDYRRVE